MKGLDVSEENLEDLLTYDDLFLDYFNAFLALPVFSQPLYYNRLTGTFTPLEGSTSDDSAGDEFVTPPYGATDEERESMLLWAKQHRLPLFLRTQLFRELKLCKLLMRPLQERPSESREQIRGYSRQTDSCVDSLSNMAERSGNDLEDFPSDDANRSALFRYQRPGSRAISLPARLTLLRNMSCSFIDESNGTHQRRQVYNEHTKQCSSAGSCSSQITRQQYNMMIDNIHQSAQKYRKRVAQDNGSENHTETTFKLQIKVPSRGTSNRTMRRSSKLMGREGDKDFLNTSNISQQEGVTDVCVTFNDDASSEWQTAHDLRQIEGKHPHLSLQQMKEQLLGSVSGMSEFQNLLEQTAGKDLFDFWLDCEYFTDIMSELDEDTQIRTILFRDIQDKHKMKLTSQAEQDIMRTSCHSYLNHDIFLRTQYDVLRRLRAYWVPRFLCHKERNNQLKSEVQQRSKVKGSITKEKTAQESHCLFPSISLVNSLPVRPDEARHLAETTNWKAVKSAGRKLDDRVKSACGQVRRCTTTPGQIQKSLRKKFMMALSKDRDAGGPFLTFLENNSGETLVPQLLFWEDVYEYEEAEQRNADRMLRLSHAWHIFNKYLAPRCSFNINANTKDRDHIHQQLLALHDTVAATNFTTAKEHAVDSMLETWLTYLKQDLKSFMDCQLRPTNTPPSSVGQLQVLLDENQRIIVRPYSSWVQRHPPSTNTERGRRLRTALSMAESIDDARQAEERRRRKEKRKEMEKERRKACRAAKLRLQEAKNRKDSKIDKVDEDEGEDDMSDVNIDEEAEPEDNSAPPFPDILNKKAMVAMFKKYVSENEGKDVMNLVNFYLDIEAYHKLSSTGKPKNHRDVHAKFIFKTYMEQGARKKIYLNDKVYSRLKTEKERPNTPTLKEAQDQIIPKIDVHFKAFWEAEQLNSGGKKLSKEDLAMQSDDPRMLMGWHKKGVKRPRRRSSSTALLTGGPVRVTFADGLTRTTGSKHDGQAQPSQEDKMSFLAALKRAVTGPFHRQMLHFYAYLRKYGEENNLLIDNDLLFYWQVHKFKEASHHFCDEEMLRRKVQSMLDSYLHCSSSPPLQISISSDLQQRTIRAAQRYLGSKDMAPSIFDEAQLQLFRDLLPYWAAFLKQYDESEECQIPVSEKELKRLRHLSAILKWRPPSAHTFILPSLPGSSGITFTFSLTDGIQWKDMANGISTSENGRSTLSYQS